MQEYKSKLFSVNAFSTVRGSECGKNIGNIFQKEEDMSGEYSLSVPLTVGEESRDLKKPITGTDIAVDGFSDVDMYDVAVTAKDRATNARIEKYDKFCVCVSFYVWRESLTGWSYMPSKKLGLK